MAYSNKRILRDADGNPIPQIWDPALDDFVPYEGKVTLSGKTRKEVDIALGVELAAGASHIVDMDMECDSIVIMGGLSGGAGNITVRVQPWVVGVSGGIISDAPYAVTLLDDVPLGNFRFITDYFRPKAKSNRIYVANRSDGTRTLTRLTLAMIYGD